MAQLNFYANSEDAVAVIDFMFEIAPMKLFEAYSRIDKEIREFKSGLDILESSHVEDNHGSIFVRGWWTSVTKTPRITKFSLNPSSGKHRYHIEGVGIFQLDQRWRMDSGVGALDVSMFSHWNEKGALQGAHYSDAIVQEVNWKLLRSLSGKVHRYVRNKMPSARFRNWPILPGAYKYMKSGGCLWGQPGVFSLESEEVEEIET